MGVEHDKTHKLDMTRAPTSQVQHQRGQGMTPETFLRQWQPFHPVHNQAAALIGTGFEGSKVEGIRYAQRLLDGIEQ